MNSKTIKLENDRLLVEIASPGSSYTRSRFDWTGGITQVTLDSKYTFCSKDTRPPAISCGGLGLMNEFLSEDTYPCDDYENKFIKIGVGVLKKESSVDEYNQKVNYEIVKHCHFEEFVSSGSYSILCRQSDFFAYSYVLEKTIVLEDNHLLINYFLLNTGNETLNFKEYNHNFLCLNPDQDIRSHQISFNFPSKIMNSEFFEQDTHTIKKLNKDTFYSKVEGFANQKNCSFTLEDRVSKSKVMESVNKPLQKCFIWGLKDVICPELIIQDQIKPGLSSSWTRTYTFNKSTEH